MINDLEAHFTISINYRSDQTDPSSKIANADPEAHQ